MTKKKKRDDTTAPANPIERYVEEVIKEVFDSRNDKLKKEDAEEIVKAILPEIESIVSTIVLKHFKAISIFVQNNLKDPEEI